MTSHAGVLSVSLAGERRHLFTGAGLLSSTMVVAGILTYGFHLLAARTLSPSEYGRIAVLWATMFIATVVIFRPLEQTTSRALAHRLAHGYGVRSVLRTILLAYLIVTLVAVLAVAAAWGPISDRVFLGDGAMVAALLVGLVFYGMAFLVRGVFGGAQSFATCGIGVLADAGARLLVAVALLFAATQNVAAAAVAIGGAAGALLPLYLGRHSLRHLLELDDNLRFDLRSALRFAAPAGVIAGADQLLVNGAPLLVVISGGRSAAGAAGVVFAATMLVRVPVYVFQGLATSLLPNITRLHATHRLKELLAPVVRAGAILLGVGALTVAASAAVGPALIQLLFGAAFHASRGALTLLAVGVVLYMATAAASQALLAVDTGRRAAAAWAASAIAFVGIYEITSGSPLWRISMAFFAAALVGFVGLATATAHRIRT